MRAGLAVARANGKRWGGSKTGRRICVTDDQGRVIGTLTDGDVRRALLAGSTLGDRGLQAIMHRDFAHVTPATGRAEVLDIMRARNINQLPVLDEHGRLCGLHTIAQMISRDDLPNSAVVLAGGRGTRLHPLTESIPKPMITVAGRPILERLVLHLMSCGIRDIHISVNYLAHVIESHFGDGSRFGCRIRYLRETEPLGTGGPLALLNPEPTLPIVARAMAGCVASRTIARSCACAFIAPPLAAANAAAKR